MRQWPPRESLPEIRCAAPQALSVPAEFERLKDLACNLWWSWTPEARLLFAAIDSELWHEYQNPLEVLRHADDAIWSTLGTSDEFQSKYHEIVGDFDRYMSETELWYPANAGAAAGRPVAYVSTEYGLHETLPIYSGGLGVLSGDHAKSASDLGIPMFCVGLLYRRGYFKQGVDADGRQQHRYPHLDLSAIPAQRVLNRVGEPLIVSVPLEDRDVKLAVYNVQVGRVSLLLLDSDVPENASHDRPITNILYVRGREMRLCQEIVLGVGAVRTLRALGIEPAVWHLNEGHSSLLLLELASEQAERGAPLDEALGSVARSIVFTTHTPVPAGNETFDRELMRRYVSPYAARIGVREDELLRLGTVEEHASGTFNMTALALRISSFRNGVSERHGDVSREMWKSLFGDGEVPIGSITNGIHVETWLGAELRNLLERRFGRNWLDTCGDEAWLSLAEVVPDGELWRSKMAHKRRLIAAARARLRRMHARHGASPAELEAVERLLDPNALTIGFARRFATYKRAGLLFQDLQRARAILSNADRPVQVLIAGKAHPADHEGQQLIANLFKLSQGENFRGRVVFIEDYDMELGRLLVQGCDVWLNNPRRPMEASGTSGQKAAANGGLNLSVLDGWWIEGYSSDVGWAIGAGGDDGSDQGAVDAEDARALYELLESEVVPLFYERDETDLPREWIRRMKISIRDLLPRFSGRRMVRNYCEQAYVPLASRDISGA
jgi:starch phosphorylase